MEADRTKSQKEWYATGLRFECTECGKRRREERPAELRDSDTSRCDRAEYVPGQCLGTVKLVKEKA